MRIIKIAAVTAAAALMLSACGAAPDKKGADAKGGDADFKACMVSDQGGFDDKSFNESGMAGLKQAEKELGIKIASAESKSPSDFKKNVDSLIQQKCSMIIGVGFLLNDAIRDAAKANPKTKFALVDSIFTEGKDFKPVELENAKPLVFNTAEAAYLAGYVAAGVSKTGTVSGYMGMQLPTTSIFLDGFADGIERYNKDNGKSVKLIGWDKAKQEGAATGNFEDHSKGQQMTEQQIAQGSDIIMPVAGPVGAGTLAAIKGKNAYMVGVDSDWAVMHPDFDGQILTSVVKEIGKSVFDSIKEAKEGKFTHHAYIGDIKNGGVSIAPFHKLEDKVPTELKEKVKAIQQEIADGKTKVESPSNPKK